MRDATQKAVFIRKAVSVQELKCVCNEMSKVCFQVERIAEITPEEFRSFQNELYEDYRVIYDNRDAMFFDTKKICYHCILFTTKERKEGVLVQAEGYAYARYAAYVADCGLLDLTKAELVAEPSMSREIPAAYYRNDVFGVDEKKIQER